MDLKNFLKFSFKVKMIFRCSGIPVFRHSGVPAFRCSGIPVFRHSGVPAFRCSGIPVFRHSFFYYMPIICCLNEGVKIAVGIYILVGIYSISYPEPSLSGSGHTGLKNDPDWSIHKLLDPYPLWRSRARPI